MDKKIFAVIPAHNEEKYIYSIVKKTKKYDFYGYVDHVPLKGIRKITAEKMTEAVRNAAMVTHHDHVDVTELAEVRNREKEKAAKKRYTGLLEKEGEEELEITGLEAILGD